MGKDGMLGSMMVHHFTNIKDYNVFTTSRRDPDSETNFNFEVTLPTMKGDITKLLQSDTKFDYVINCIGIIKPHMPKSLPNAITVNSVFPHVLAELGKDMDTRVIHITTDCVFSGKHYCYTEAVSHDALDAYGKSKSLGEPDNCLVLRTSIIGPEVNNAASLIEQVKKNAGKTMQGYCHHIWNGVTTLQLAKICDDIILRGMWCEGTRHVFSPSPVDKFELLTLINERYKLNVKIIPYTDDNTIDRGLGTVYLEDFLEKLNIPDIKDQLNDLPY